MKIGNVSIAKGAFGRSRKRFTAFLNASGIYHDHDKHWQTYLKL